ncbi:MAG: hypothetical protein ACRENG_26365, partial [bacterium]
MEHWSDTTPLQKVAPAAKDPDSTGLAEHPNVSSRENTASHEAMTDEFDPDGVLPLYHPSLQVFPKEFNKNYLESLDRRYWVILLVTLLFEPLLIWYLMRAHPVGMTENEIAKLQNKYAELFLSEFRVEDPLEEEKAYNELLLRATEAIPQIVGEATGVEPNINLSRVRPNANPEARALPGEQREALRRINTATRQRGMQALSEHVERIGLL